VLFLTDVALYQRSESDSSSSDGSASPPPSPPSVASEPLPERKAVRFSSPLQAQIPVLSFSATAESLQPIAEFATRFEREAVQLAEHPEEVLEAIRRLREAEQRASALREVHEQRSAAFEQHVRQLQQSMELAESQREWLRTVAGSRKRRVVEALEQEDAMLDRAQRKAAEITARAIIAKQETSAVEHHHALVELLVGRSRADARPASMLNILALASPRRRSPRQHRSASQRAVRDPRHALLTLRERHQSLESQHQLPPHAAQSPLRARRKVTSSASRLRAVLSSGVAATMLRLGVRPSQEVFSADRQHQGPHFAEQCVSQPPPVAVQRSETTRPRLIGARKRPGLSLDGLVLRNQHRLSLFLESVEKRRDALVRLGEQPQTHPQPPQRQRAPRSARQRGTLRSTVSARADSVGHSRQAALERAVQHNTDLMEDVTEENYDDAVGLEQDDSSFAGVRHAAIRRRSLTKRPLSADSRARKEPGQVRTHRANRPRRPSFRLQLDEDLPAASQQVPLVRTVRTLSPNRPAPPVEVPPLWTMHKAPPASSPSPRTPREPATLKHLAARKHQQRGEEIPSLIGSPHTPSFASVTHGDVWSEQALRSLLLPTVTLAVTAAPPAVGVLQTAEKPPPDSPKQFRASHRSLKQHSTITLARPKRPPPVQDIPAFGPSAFLRKSKPSVNPSQAVTSPPSPSEHTKVMSRIQSLHQDARDVLSLSAAMTVQHAGPPSPPLKRSSLPKVQSQQEPKPPQVVVQILSRPMQPPPQVRPQPTPRESTAKPGPLPSDVSRLAKQRRDGWESMLSSERSGPSKVRRATPLSRGAAELMRGVPADHPAWKLLNIPTVRQPSAPQPIKPREPAPPPAPKDLTGQALADELARFVVQGTFQDQKKAMLDQRGQNETVVTTVPFSLPRRSRIAALGGIHREFQDFVSDIADED
jgi:hypothetical protein